jgi:hypothetical protein
LIARDRPAGAVGTGRADGDARPRSLCADELGIARAKFRTVMRHDNEEDPKKPEPIAVTKKGTNALEAAEGSPWLIRKGDDRDRHRHVV